MYIIFLFLFNFCYADYFIQIPDIHYDKNYVVGAPTKCLLDITGCCRNSSITFTTSKPAGKWGDYNCDSPGALITKTFEEAAKFNPDFVFFTGDIVDHNIIHQRYDDNIEEIEWVIDQFKLFNTNNIFPVLGNHDTFPIDQTAHIYGNMMDNIFTKWSEIYKLDAPNGYYSVYLKDNLRLISINSVWYDKLNLFRLYYKNKLYNQYEWLKVTLEESKNKGDIVWIINHIVPDMSESTNYYNNMIGNIMYTYKDIIKLNLYGHIHSDTLKLYKKEDQYIGSGFISSSLMPDNHDPCFRVYEYDRENYNVLDYHQYCANLTETELNYKKIYSFSTTYDEKDLSLESVVSVYNKLINNKELAKLYCSYKQPINKNLDNDGKCIKEIVSEL